MIIECPECGTKNSTDKPPQPGTRYRCGKCGALITFTQTADTQGIFTKVPPEKACPKSQEEVKREQVPKKRKRGCSGCLGLIVAFIIIVVVINLFSSDENPRYIYKDGAIITGADGEPIELINNPDATNPTYAELVAFIKEDTSDNKTYSEGFEQQGRIILAHMCADFAEDVHNNAEAAGIRAALVGIDLKGKEIGHACNAFETTDRGLVYVDCTGTSISERLRSILGDSPMSRDHVAYVEIGNEYGCIDIDKAKSPSYSFYDEYKQKGQEYHRLLSEYDEEVIRYNRETETWNVTLDGSKQILDRVATEYEIMLIDYNDAVAQYNQEIKQKVYQEGSSDMGALVAWKSRLEGKEQTIDKAYQEYDRLRADYNNEVAQYNQEIKAWEARLEGKKRVIVELVKELGNFWLEPLGIVDDICKSLRS